MAADLLARIRKNREFKKTIGKFTFTCRRPTDQEASEFRLTTAISCEIAQRFVVGWAGVLDMDIDPGNASSDPVEFNPAVWREWCADNMQWWSLCAKHREDMEGNADCPDCAPLTRAITSAYEEHKKAMEDAAKNSLPA